MRREEQMVFALERGMIIADSIFNDDSDAEREKTLSDLNNWSRAVKSLLTNKPCECSLFHHPHRRTEKCFGSTA